jgi:acetylornithine/N-succinyldiaminopimelate aminotransferase
MIGDSKTLILKEQNSILQTYKRLPVVIDRAEGCRIYDKEGNEYLDFLGGIAVNALGHSHPKIIDAVISQAKKYMHVSNYFYQDIQISLAEKLKELTGFDKVFFSNSGTEALEGAMKLIRRWGKSRGKNEIISFTGGFHGRTYGALSIMDKPLYKDNMGPFLTGTKILPYNDINSIEKNIGNGSVAVVLEFLQGEGGIVMAEKSFIEKLAELKQKFGFLLIADEIQSGTGRTGNFLFCENYSIKPDIVIMAKGIGGGLPLGCILVREHLSGIFEKGMHGTTYGGNAVACAAGLVVLNELQNGLMEQVRQVGSYLSDSLKELQKKYPEIILETRGTGLMQGLLLSIEASILVNSLINRKVITNAASGNVLRLVPPLIVKKSDIEIFIDALNQSLEEFKKI